MLIGDRREPEKMRDQCDAVRTLAKGDYLIIVNSDGERRMLIERKTASDFWASLQSKRLQEQLLGCDILIFEKCWVPKKTGIDWNRLYSALNGVAAHTVVMQTNTPVHTIKQLRLIETKLRSGEWGAMRRPVILPSPAGTENEDAVRILMGFPGVAEGRAMDILVHYGCLQKALDSVDAWADEVKGIGPKTARAARAVLDRAVTGVAGAR